MKSFYYYFCGWVGVETEVNAKLSPTELKLELGLSLATIRLTS